MKILTVAIPCYNSAAYMENCIKSILPVGEDVEILIVNDGSQKDDTPAIADRWAAKYPTIIRAIHQENGGHGSAVNTGIRNASGLYYKVVDSDDWVNTKALKRIVDRLKALEEENTPVDMLVANFVYDKVDASHKKLMRFKHVFPENRIFGWDDIGHMNETQYILMHNVIYRLQLLKDCGIELPSHTFYVDNLFVFEPLPSVEKLYYMDVNLYHYFIGREDQSVNEKVMIGRIDQQLAVNYRMIDTFTELDFTGRPRGLKKYMLIYLSKLMAVSSSLLLVDGSPEALEKKKKLWSYVKARDKQTWKKLRFGLLGMGLNLPGRVGRKISYYGYKLTQKLIGFN